MRIKLKIRAKLLLFVIMGLVLAFSIFGAFRIYQTEASFTEAINQSGEERVRLIAESIANMIVAYDYGNLESVAERIAKLQDVQKIRILNRNGKVMVSQTRADSTDTQNVLLYSSPVMFAGDYVGHVELELSLERGRAAIRATYRNVIAAMVLMTLFLAALLYGTVTKLIISPLTRLSDAANQLAQGNFTATLPEASDDELGNLTRAFDSMRNSRHKAEDELHNLNASLETIVMARVAELRDSEAYVHAVLDNVNEGIIVVDQNGLIISFNTAAEKIFGYTDQEAITQSFSLLISSENLGLSGKYHKYSEQEGDEPVFGITREVVGMRKDYSAFPLELKTSQLRIQNRLLYITTARDISDRKEAEQRIRYMASHDALTSLPNRTLLQDRIQQTLVHNQRRNLKSAVMFIDLDKFKIINDTLGHDVGDNLLKEAARRLTAEIRAEDTLARQGGDEFIILLANISNPQDAGVIAQKLLGTLTQPFLIKGKELHISASIGIAIFPDDGYSMESLLKNSDTAMYHAKESGRNNYQFFSSSMNEHAAEKQALSSDLRYAIERKELFLVYQPIADILTDEMTGMEVLLRWKHAERGLIPPDKFIPLAEDTGLILQIGEWVIKTACAQIQSWHTAGYSVPRLAINLSAKQFRQKSLVNVISSILEESCVEACNIGIEITESMLAENIGDVADTLRALNKMGVEISIDDFGTGYSSLSYLKRFPINKLKIDKSFVDDMTIHKDDEAIVTAIIAMAKSLRMTVVSEGVETREQLESLQQLGCEQYQGYIISMPLPADKIVGRLARAN